MYDRTLLRAVATAKGQRTYVDLADHLKVAPVTGWRLWNGKTAPSAKLAARVEAAYGLSIAQLIQPEGGQAA